MSKSNYCFLTCIQISQGGRSGGLVFPSLEELSAGCHDPAGQRQKQGIVMVKMEASEHHLFLEFY